MGNIKRTIKNLGLLINGVAPTEKIISKRIQSIGDNYLSLNIVAYTGDEDLWGKKANQLQKDVVVSNGVVSGELYYVENFDPQSNLNHFLVLQATANINGATITGQIINGLSPATTLDADGIIMFKLDPTKEQSLQFVVSKNGFNRTYNLTLDLTFDEQN